MLNLYLLRRADGDYDENMGFVIAAETPKRAREIAAKNCGDEGAAVWLSADGSSLKTIGEARNVTQPGVVLSDYRAG